MDEIGKFIAHLRKVKEALIGSENNLRFANEMADNRTIKRLASGNLKMKAKFDEDQKNLLKGEPEFEFSWLLTRILVSR